MPRSAHRRNTPGDSMIKKLAGLFGALADENRLMILDLLATHGEMSVGAIGKVLKQSQPAVSHHLTQLKNAKLIRFRREGKFNFYLIDPEGMTAAFAELGMAPGETVKFTGLEFEFRIHRDHFGSLPAPN